MRRPLLAACLTVAALIGAACSSASRTEVEGADEATSTTRAPTTTAPPTTAPTTTVPPTTTTTAAPTPEELAALRPPPPAPDAPQLAAQIAAAEAALRDPASDQRALATAALAQQVAYRQLGRHPEWDAAVDAALPAPLRPIARHHAAARREFSAMHTRLRDTLPAWHIIPPADADTLLAAYRDADAAFGIPWRYLAAINLVETQLGRIRGTSTAGALGPMQFMPATWAAYGQGDINDVQDSVMAAARYLAANNGAVDIDNALYRYNHSNHYVQGVKLYADLIAEHPRAFFGFHHWGVWYLTSTGDVFLPVGYRQDQPIPVATYRPT